MLSIGTFVRVVVILAGLANAFVVANWPVASARLEMQYSSPFLVLALIGSVAGLLATEVLLRLARSLLLLGDFLARYASSLLGVSLGGSIFAALLASPGDFNESPETIPSRIVIFLEAGAVFGVVGGIIGTLEGSILGFPLATILGLFGNRT